MPCCLSAKPNKRIDAWSKGSTWGRLFSCRNSAATPRRHLFHQRMSNQHKRTSELIFILADDLGNADLGCTGSREKLNAR